MTIKEETAFGKRTPTLCYNVTVCFSDFTVSASLSFMEFILLVDEK